ncbi:MAG: electron transfer flavoprotein subunit alpha/FixB family protein, partial [Candidatus Bathyarchaeia archaeon]
IVEDSKLENFNSDAYQKVLEVLIKKYRPTLTLIGHTSYGIELAPSLAVSLSIPLATDCIDFYFDNNLLYVIRQMYGGKVNVKAALRSAENYIVTVRPATFTITKPQMPTKGTLIKEPSPLIEEIKTKRFIKYVIPPPTAVDISTAEKLVSIGRGIKDSSNMPIIEELAKVLGATIACSRPIVDKGWLPSERQVGNSGKTVKPKLYLAIGISGAFQHVMGMKNSELIISINKDPKAPIFNYSDYAVIEDLFKIVPALTNKITAYKNEKSQ